MSRPLRVRALSALALVAAALLGAAHAEEPAPASYGEELEVVGARPLRAASDRTAATTVVEASRFAGEAKTVAELVATAPGVAVNGYGGLGQLSTVSIRGSTADQVQVFLDGLPLNGAAGGGVDLSRIPRAWIERIEVVRGAEGALYGPGAAGGALDILTRPAAAGSWAAEASGGSFRTFSASADGATGGRRWGLLGAAAVDTTGGRFTYQFDPTPAVGDGTILSLQRDHNSALTAGALAKAWAAVGAGRLDAALQLSGGSRDLPGSPYALTPSDGQDDRRAGLVARLIEPLGDDLDLVVGASARRDRLTVRVKPFPEARQDGLALDTSARLLWTTGPSTLTLRAAVSTERLDVPAAAGHARTGGALGLSDELTLAGGRWHLEPALRWDVAGPFSGLSAKLGTALQLSEVLSARASAGHGFRLPSFSELYLEQGRLTSNPALVPEQSWSADAGLAAEGRLGFASAGVFVQLYRDLIVYESDSFGRMKPFNDGKARASGLELELASAPVGPAGLTVSAAYTYLATATLRGDEAALGKDLPHRARHRLFGRLGAGRGPVEGHAEVHALSSQHLDLRSSPALTVPAALSFNLGGSVRVFRRPDTRLDLELRNLLDDRSLQDGFGNPLPGRMVMVTLRVAGGKDAPP